MYDAINRKLPPKLIKVAGMEATQFLVGEKNCELRFDGSFKH